MSLSLSLLHAQTLSLLPNVRFNISSFGFRELFCKPVPHIWRSVPSTESPLKLLLGDWEELAHMSVIRSLQLVPVSQQLIETKYIFGLVSTTRLLIKDPSLD